MDISRSIVFSSGLYAQVRAIAEREGVRISDQIVQWIVEGVARDGRADTASAAPRDDGRQPLGRGAMRG